MKVHFALGDSGNGNGGAGYLRDMRDLHRSGTAVKIHLGMETNAAKGGGRDTKAISDAALAHRPLRLLASYFYYKDEDMRSILDLFKGRPVELFADSGAYSAHSLGDEVKEDDYIAWVNRWADCFTCVSAPDVIGNAAETLNATNRMMKQVKKVQVLPVFHVGEDWSFLTHWVGKVDYLAFGGMVPYSRNRPLLKAWIAKAFRLLPKEMRVHGFGMTTWELLKLFPWYSVDSSSWTASFRYAQLQLFDAGRGRFATVSMRDRHALLANSALLKSYGLNPSQALAHNYDRTTVCGVAVESWQRAEEWLTKKWGGPRVSLVTVPGAPNSFETISEATK